MDTTTDKNLQTQLVQSHMAEHEPEAWGIVQGAMSSDLSKWGTLATYQVMETCGHHYQNR